MQATSHPLVCSQQDDLLAGRKISTKTRQLIVIVRVSAPAEMTADNNIAYLGNL